MQLGLHVTHHGRWAVVAASGELDMASAPSLRQCVMGLVGDGDVHIALDCSGLSFLDSTGLGVIVACLKRVRSHDGDLCLVCPEHRIRRVFSIPQLDRVFEIHERIDEVER